MNIGFRLLRSDEIQRCCLRMMRQAAKYAKMSQIAFFGVDPQKVVVDEFDGQPEGCCGSNQEREITIIGV